MISIRKASTLLVAAMIAGTWAVPAQSQSEISVRLQIDEITCREALKMPGDERAFTVIFFHGFMSGKTNQTLFDGPALAEATDKIADFCIDNPSEKLMKAFEAVRK